MKRSARREVNRDSLELWLVTRGVGVRTRPPNHPDEYHGRVGKPGTKYNQDDTWLMAISQPDAMSANRFFEDAIRRVPTAAYMALCVAYIGPDGDPSLPEIWRRTAHSNAADSMRLIALEKLWYLDEAFSVVLDRADHERRLLYWPSPEDAKEYVEENIRKRRDALYFYQRNLDAGDAATLAVKKAAVSARCSQQAIWKWLAQLNGASWVAKPATKERVK